MYLVCTVGVDTVDQVPVLVLHVLEADIPQDTGVVEKHIDAAKVLDSGIDDALAVLDAVVVGYRVTASGADLVDDHIGSLEKVSGYARQIAEGDMPLLTFPHPCENHRGR